jgi:hypothetical protein
MNTTKDQYFNTKTINKSHVATLLLYVVSLLLLFTNLRIFSYFICIVVLSSVLPLRSKSFGIVTKFIISFLLIICAHQIIGLLFWKLGLRFTYFWALFPLLTIITLFLFIKPKKISKFSLFNNDELIAIIISSFFVLVVVFSTISSGPILQKLIQYSSTGFDYSTHQSLVLSTYDTEGYIYGIPERVSSKIVYTDLSAYPQGWHLANSIIWRGLDNNLLINELAKVMGFFFATTMLWYGIVTYLIVILVLKLKIILKGNRLTFLDHIIPIGSVILVQFAAVLHVLENGFVNYIGLISYLIAFLLIVLGFYDNGMRKRHYAIIGSILSVGIAFTWLLAAPIGFIILALVLFKNINLPKVVKLITSKDLAYIIVFIAICLSSIIQLFITIQYSQIPNHINASGGVWSTNYGLLSILSLIFFALVVHRDVKNKVSEPLLISFSSVALLCSAIYIIQIHTAAKTGYYSDKVNILLLILLIPIIGALMAGYTKKLVNSHGIFAGLFITIVAFIIFPMMLSIDMTSTRFMLARDRKLSAYSSAQITELHRIQQKFDNNIIVFKELDYEEDIITTHMLNSISRVQSECSRNIFSSQLINDKDKLINEISRCANERPLVKYSVIASNKNYNQLRAEFKNIRNVNVILSN